MNPYTMTVAYPLSFSGQPITLPLDSIQPVVRPLDHPPFSTDFLSCVFQPQIGLMDQRIKGVELLLRGKTNGYNLSGDQCIQWASDHEKKESVNHWVIEQAVCHASLIPHNVMMSFNICAQDLSMDIAQFLIKTLSVQNITPEKICVEITEHFPPKSFTDLVKVCRFLRRHGVKIAIDDFGTGHATLSYLVALELDFIKIDKSYVRDIALVAAKEKILKSLLDLVEIAECMLIFEGVEKKEDEAMLINILKHRSPSWVQGYLYGKPASFNMLDFSMGADTAMHFSKASR